MTELQLTQIRNYLLERKLPLDILLEVQDHFVSQINDLQKEENLSFDEALTKTKNSWQNELKPYWDGELDLQNRSKLLRNINRNNFWMLTKKSTLYAVPIIIFLFALTQVLTVDLFEYVFLFFVGFIYSTPVVKYFLNYRDFELLKKYQNHTLVSIQQYTMLMIGGIYFYFKFIAEGYKIAVNFYEFFVNPEWESFFGGIVLTLFILLLSFIVYFSQGIYLSKIQKVKPFLQYLEPSK